jgi:hypothetical protein
MLRKSKYLNYSGLLLACLLVLAGCKKEEYALPTPQEGLQNDAIKRSLGPNMVGQRIEFAYAMAILPDKGKLASAQVEASIPGAPATFLEHNSYYTGNNGADVAVQVAQPSVTSGAATSVTFLKDTSASTLRYYYVIPEEARGKTVSFKFSATASNGQTVTFNLGPYTISKMDMVRTLAVSNNNLAYLSIEDMTVYNAAGAAANAGKIDFVFLYRKLTTSEFNHALVSPAADPVYLPGVTLPAGLNRSTKTRKVFGLPDYDLARTAVGVYIDDVDFEKLDLSEAPNYAINLKSESGVWLETADGKFRAYIYFNSVNANGSAVISIKRYRMQ